MEGGNVFLFVGQFGNQIGMKVAQSLALLNDGDVLQTNNCFISIDTEQKATKAFFAKSHNEKIVIEKCILDRTGRGGNWAMGYNLQCDNMLKTPAHEIVLRTVKRKIDKCYNCLPGIVMIHSLIGGTGGGLGSCILESIKEEFPEIHVTSVTTAPFVSGESPMQHFNSLLTLAWLQRYADCVFLFHNDDMLNEIAKRNPKPTTKEMLTQISLDEINDYICYSIADLFHPFSFDFKERFPHGICKHKTSAERKNSKTDLKVGTINSHKVAGLKEKTDLVLSNEDSFKKYESKRNPHSDFVYDKRKGKMSLDFRQTEKDIIRTSATAVTGKCHVIDYHVKETDATVKSSNVYEQLVVNCHMKFVSCKHKHSKKFISEYLPLLKSLLLNQPRRDHEGHKYKVSSMLLSARGEFAKLIGLNEEEVVNFLKRNIFFGKDCDENLRIATSYLPVATYSSPLSLSLYVNSNRIADYLEHVLYKSAILYEHSAYIHWFHKFGITNDYFTDARSTLTRVVDEYHTL